MEPHECGACGAVCLCSCVEGSRGFRVVSGCASRGRGGGQLKGLGELLLEEAYSAVLLLQLLLKQHHLEMKRKLIMFALLSLSLSLFTNSF